MKKLLPAIFVLSALFLPVAVYATPVSWDAGGNILQPLQALWGYTVKATNFTSTSTTAVNTFPHASTTQLTATGSTWFKGITGSTQCLRVDTNGLLSGTGSACATGTVTGVTGTYPIVSSGGATPAISLAFGTSTSNTWGGTQTFTSSPVLGSLTGIIKGSSGTLSTAANGTDYTLLTAQSCSAGSHISALTAAGGSTCTADSGGAGTIGTTTALSSGQVDFSTGVNTIGNDSNFYWDNTNKRLSIGIGASPTQALDVSGSIKSSNQIILPYSVGSKTSNSINWGGNAAIWLQTGLHIATDASNPNVLVEGASLFSVSDGTGTFFSVARNQTTVFDNSVAGLAFTLQVINGADNTAGTAGGIVFTSGQGGSTRGKGGLVYNQDGTGFDRGDFQFLQDSGGDTTKVDLADAILTIKNSGKTGVGTTTPWGRLSASSTSAYPAFVAEQKSTGPAAIFLGGNVGLGTTSPYAQLSLGGGNLVLGAATTGGTPGDLFLPKLGTAAGSFLAVDATGKVIATTTPSSGTVTSVALTAPTGLSVSGSPVTTSGTLALSLTAGYVIPLVASTTDWNTAYLNRITSASTPLSISGNAISIQAASGSQNGYLSSTDWTTFNNKVATTRTLTAGNGLTGGGDLSADRTFAIDFTRANTWSGLQTFSNTGTTTFAGGVQAVTAKITGLAEFIGNTIHQGLAIFNAGIQLAASTYINFGATTGSSGYGIRDNGGTVEIKNSGGAWAAPATAPTTYYTASAPGSSYIVVPVVSGDVVQVSATAFANSCNTGTHQFGLAYRANTFAATTSPDGTVQLSTVGGSNVCSGSSIIQYTATTTDTVTFGMEDRNSMSGTRIMAIKVH